MNAFFWFGVVYFLVALGSLVRFVISRPDWVRPYYGWRPWYRPKRGVYIAVSVANMFVGLVIMLAGASGLAH